MLNFDVKRKINTLRDILVGKVPDPKAQVEQITIALIYKFMDDMDLQAAEFGGEREFFKNDYSKYAFSQIMLPEHSAQDRLNLYAEGIDKMTNNPDLPKLFRDILRNAYIPYRDPETLNRFLKEIAEFSYEDSEELGNAFEYLLSIMGSQGDAGQFRTPRHIIDMMVEITAPTKNETILDPACGTAGFLISAYNYIKKSNLDEQGKSTLVADDMTRMTKNFAGYDISPDMVRLSRVNMYLHGFTSPNISEYDTLTSLEKWDDNFDVIFSNPPFMTPKGGITPHNRYQVSAKRSEVLFVDYIAEHLTPTGRAAIIVPEGIVFQSQTAYKNLRQMLVDGNYLYGVISLPAGVFNPYSGVKTSILLIDKKLAKERDSILFVKLNNDGFDLGAQRREIKDSEIPDVVNTFIDFQRGIDISERENVILAKKDCVSAQEYILVGERYLFEEKSIKKYQMSTVGEVCSIIRGLTFGKSQQLPYSDETTLKVATTKAAQENGIVEEYLYNVPKELLTDNTKLLQNGDILISTANSLNLVGRTTFVEGISYPVSFGAFMTLLRPNEKIIPKLLFYLLKSENAISYFRLQANTTTNISNLSSASISAYKIPLPPLTVQEEIVAEIESYQKIIEGARQVVENYKPTIKIDPAWETAELGSVATLLNGRAYKQDELLHEGKYPVLRVGNFFSNRDWYYSDLELEPEKYCDNGDLLFAWSASFGPKIWEGGKVIYHYHIWKIVLTDRIDRDYLFYILYGLSEKIKNQGHGIAMIHATKGDMEKMLIPLPSIGTQKSIASRMNEEVSIVERNKRLIEIFQQKIKDKIAEVWGE